MPKKVIAVDIDDVLAQFAEAFVEFSNKRWGTHLTIDDWTEHWAEMWGVDYEEEERRAKIVRKSDIFINFSHNKNAREVLRILSKKYKLVVVTSRHRAISKDTLKWLDQNYKDIFSEVHFAGIWDNLEKHTFDKLKLTKASVCKQIGADYLIDDQPKHCLAAAQAGITALLFGDYKWTKVSNLPKNVIPVKTWPKVLEYFNAKG